MKKNIFNKVGALNFLKKYESTSTFIIPNFFSVSKKDYKLDKKSLLKKIKNFFNGKKIILRSSSLNEDTKEFSNAGKFKSFGNIDYNNDKKIINSCDEIIKDFKNNSDRILIQEFIYKPKISGVIFSRDINNNAPYCTINYDSSGKTNLITAGKKNPTMKNLVLFRKNSKNYNFFGIRLNILDVIEKIFKNNRLDIEFCIKKNIFYLLQCRHLKHLPQINDVEIEETLINIKKKINKINKATPGLAGDKTFYSNMSDWNPAEMIGVKPKPLALSLYAELITDKVWATQRKNFGYKDVAPNCLMVSFAGMPYVDLRTDFNSFLPAKLPEKIQKKAINYYLNSLRKNPSNHDKIEFKTIETCFDLDTYRNLKAFLNKKDSEIYLRYLKEITNNVLDKKNNILFKEKKKVDSLLFKIENIKKSNLSEIQKIFFLINDCKKYGTLPFAGIARVAFIYTKILKTLVNREILSKKDFILFYENADTITKSMFKDLRNIKNKKNKNDFLKKYGHLRPSTYYIDSKNYKENFNEYFSKKNLMINNKRNKFKISKSLKIKINKILKENNLQTNCDDFFDNARKSIQYREYAKFVFSKSINEIFVNLINLGKEVKILRKDLDYLSIKNIMNFYSNVNVKKLKKLLKEEIVSNKREQKILKLLNVPEFISQEKDLYLQKERVKEGSFVTNKSIIASILNFKKIKKFNLLKGKIILLDNADPGYDFIFSHNIKGLVTRYGGANSHMSIRSLELGVPAIIGVGPKDFETLINANTVEINCEQKFFRIIN